MKLEFILQDSFTPYFKIFNPETNEFTGQVCFDTLAQLLNEIGIPLNIREIDYFKLNITNVIISKKD